MTHSSMSTDSLSGQVLAGRYRIGSVLGTGGMGTVYEAVHIASTKRVAVKVLRPELVNEPDVLTRFQREAQAISSLHHPHIVKVTDFEQPDDAPPYLVMELLEGQTLRARIARTGAQEPKIVVSLAIQVLDALAAAHAAGVVHRDLKPDNVFVVPQPGDAVWAKLLDFGIAKLMESHEYTRLTRTGVLIGTPAYMAPELLTDQHADERSDLYALGVTMYGAIAARLPFRGKTATDMMRAVLAGSPEPLESRCPGLPRTLYEIIERAMAFEPAHRFGSAREMREALQRVSFGAVDRAVPRPSLHPPFDRPMSLPPRPASSMRPEPEQTETITMTPQHALDVPSTGIPAPPALPRAVADEPAPTPPTSTASQTKVERAYSPRGSRTPVVDQGVSPATMRALAAFAILSVLFLIAVAILK